jgi:Holliday junction resolvase RusA-like endonuclease
MPRYDVSPCAKVRQTQSDKWKQRPCVMRYRAFADECRRLNISLEDGDAITFYIEMPKSWSKKVLLAFDGQPHRSKPDLDNLVGGLMDAVLPGGDSHISRLSTIQKVWARKPGIEVTSPYAEPEPYASQGPESSQF